MDNVICKLVSHLVTHTHTVALTHHWWHLGKQLKAAEVAGSRFTVRLIGEREHSGDKGLVLGFGLPLFGCHIRSSLTQLICHLIGGPLINLI